MDFQLKPVVDFGKQPIANAFLTKEQLEKITSGKQEEYFFNMVLGYDPKTSAVGLVNTVPPEKMFHDSYAYFASTSKAMQVHFYETAKKLLPYAQKGIVVELGSNDGIMLEAWKQLGVPAIGVDPSRNVAEFSQKRGHEVIIDFLNKSVVDRILAKGSVSLVYGANVSCHVAEFVDYLTHITNLIGKKGVFVFEDPYLLDIIEKTSYDQIYDEHAWFFTVRFINNVLAPFGFHVFDAEHVETHGGGLRMYVGHKDTYKAKPVVAQWLAKEENIEQKLELFAANVKKSKVELVALLEKVKKEGKRVCGFGATSKATTIFNYCGIGPDLIPFVTDNTPIKQGKFYPGVHIPVVPQEQFSKDIDVAFLCAWNHINEINKYFPWFKENGGKWLTHVPMPHII